MSLAGSMSAAGGVVTGADVVAGGKSLKLHIHGGVQTGSGVTSTPI